MEAPTCTDFIWAVLLMTTVWQKYSVNSPNTVFRSSPVLSEGIVQVPYRHLQGLPEATWN